MVTDWRGYLRNSSEEEKAKVLKQAGRVGSPLGSDDFIEALEVQLGRTLQSQESGRKKK